VDRPAQELAIVTRGFAHRRQHRADFGRRQRRQVNDFEPCGRVAQQAMGTDHVARGQHEAIAGLGQRLHQIAQHVAQSRETLERAQLEHLVEEERGRLVAGAGARQVGERVIEGLACRRRPVGRDAGDKRPGLGQRREEAFGRTRRALDIDVLARLPPQPIGQDVQRGGAATAAAAQQDRDTRWGCLERREDAPLETRMWSHHRRASAIGILTPCCFAD
jgi:hypothetical protein